MHENKSCIKYAPIPIDAPVSRRRRNNMDIAAGFGFNDMSTGAVARTEPHSGWKSGPDPVVMRLDLSRVAVLHASGPVEICCTAGQLWITMDGVTEDVILQAGQCHQLAGPAHDVILTTLGACCPATFGVRPLKKASTSRWPFGRKVSSAASRFQLEFA
jgi:hypothetical protein